ncbi:MAG TPA: aminotransferase class IV, partial [Kiloniellales bacterium]|nr:aminotransferase class IV [Kiloniellales bacterium]
RLGDLLRGLFPCGSITGAPKVRTMEIIRELEAEPRGVYTGAVGHVSPDGDLRFNVAIRTLAVRRDGAAELGIGSGIVHDSDPAAEYEECLLKSRFLTDPPVTFRLIETLRWDPVESFVLLEAHLKRLAESAAHFGFSCDTEAVRAALGRAVAGATRAQRVRLLLDEEGEISVTADALSPIQPAEALRFVVSDRPVARDDPFLYHKTTRRTHYEAELARHKTEHGCDEVIFVNKAGELTEGSWTNLFVELDGTLFTPPVESGLLDGTFRQSLFADPAVRIAERILTPADLARADRIWLGNSVRGLMPARLAEMPAQPLAAAGATGG